MQKTHFEYLKIRRKNSLILYFYHQNIYIVNKILKYLKSIINIANLREDFSIFAPQLIKPIDDSIKRQDQ